MFLSQKVRIIILYNKHKHKHYNNFFNIIQYYDLFVNKNFTDYSTAKYKI